MHTFSNYRPAFAKYCLSSLLCGALVSMPSLLAEEYADSAASSGTSSSAEVVVAKDAADKLKEGHSHNGHAFNE